MNEPQPSADDLFQTELDRRGLTYRLDSTGNYEIKIDDVNATVSLENIRRNYERDGDSQLIVRFAEQLTANFFGDTPSWEEVRPWVRFCLEPSDYIGGFGDTFHEIVSDDLVKVFVHVPPDGSRISWISMQMVADWGVTEDLLRSTADQNMNAIIDQTELESQLVDDVPLGMFNTQETPFKASLILASEFCDLVSPTHGWPVYVVVPARDFAYVVPTANRDFLGRLGAVVVREFRESGHPITMDVLEVGDNGVTAIGSFASKGE